MIKALYGKAKDINKDKFTALDCLIVLFSFCFYLHMEYEVNMNTERITVFLLVVRGAEDLTQPQFK